MKNHSASVKLLHCIEVDFVILVLQLQLYAAYCFTGLQLLAFLVKS